MMLVILFKRVTNGGNVSRRAYYVLSAVTTIESWFRQFFCICQLINICCMVSRKLNFSFKPIQKSGNEKISCKYIPIYRRSFNERNKQAMQQIKHKEMTPSKFHHFSSFIKDILQLVYGFNLHTYTCFFLSIFIIAYQYLKRHLYCVSYSRRKICQHFFSLALLLVYHHGDKIMVFKNYDINIKKPQAHTCRGVTGGNN